MKKISLFYKEGSSDKEYHVQVVQAPGSDLYLVKFQYGRRGSTLTDGCKTPSPLPLDKAEKIFADIVKKQMAKGYTEGAEGTPYVGGDKQDRVTGMFPQLLNPIDECDVEQYLKSPSWGAQEKKDGKHIMVKAKDGVVTASNRKGLQVGIPEPVAKALTGFVVELDGEMIGDVYHVFDCLSSYKLSLRASPYDTRHLQLDGLVGISDAIKVVPLARTEEQKRALYARLKKENKEGIVFKRLSSVYAPGRPSSGGDMLKHKFYATCSCMVVAGRDGKRSIGLALNDVKGPRDIAVVNVGNCTVPANQSIPKVGDIVEIRYLYAYKGGSLYQPTLIGIRDDLDQVACDMDQLKYKAEEE
jgi:bifunctional non-homologous end joining protein LigD